MSLCYVGEKLHSITLTQSTVENYCMGETGRKRKPNTGATQHRCTGRRCRQRAQRSGRVAAVAGSAQAELRALKALKVPLKADLRILKAPKGPSLCQAELDP